MLHKLTSSYREIAKYFPELQGRLSFSDNMKQVLMDMAMNGEPKPKGKRNPLALALFRYTKKGCSDEKFKAAIKKARPDWFVSPTEIVNQKKKQLLSLARKGKPRPKSNTKIGSSLCTYTLPSQKTYDTEFTTEIKGIAPHWFSSEISRQKKEQLLDLAKKGNPKPNVHKTKMGKALYQYTSKKAEQYDEVFHGEIMKIRPDWFLLPSDKAEQKKQQLVAMAKKRRPRPNTMKTKIGASLTGYTNPNSRSYDPEFNEIIRELAPQWFVSRSEIANQKKEQLLALAKERNPKPKQDTKLGRAFVIYTTKSSSYDPKFTKEIKKIAPEWFVSQTEIANDKKTQLLKIAKNKKLELVRKSSLGLCFSRYTKRSSGSYDHNFTKEIKKIRPDWFVPQRIQKAAKRKKTFIEMAKNGSPRPGLRTKLGYPLCEYTRKNGSLFDPAFAKKIKRLRPDWFAPKQSKSVAQKKSILLDMAKNKKPRPNAKTKLGCALCAYSKKGRGSYDKVFDETIRSLRPDWFVSRSEIANQKKEDLIKMAKDGKPRPNTMKTKIGANLTGYINPNKSSYDPAFAKEIKKLAPHWFVSASEKANQKKQHLLAMAKKKRPRPKTNIGVSLAGYINPNNGTYDADFATEIKKLAPHWFQKRIAK